MGRTNNKRPGEPQRQKARDWQAINSDDVKKSIIKSGCGCDIPLFTFLVPGQSLEGRVRPCYKRDKNDRARCAHVHSYSESGEEVVIAIRMSAMLWKVIANKERPLWGQWVRITYKGKKPMKHGHAMKIFLIEVDKGAIAPGFEEIGISPEDCKSRKTRERSPICSSTIAILILAVFLCGCSPDGYSLGLLTTRIPGGPGPIEPKQLYGLIFSLHWKFPQKGNTMAEEKPETTFCPNCRQPAVRTGNEIACENCDAVFVITKKEGPKVKELGPLKDLTKRVEILEAAQQTEPVNPGPDDDQNENDEEEEPIL